MTREERHIAVLGRMLENMDVYDSIQPTTERKKAIKAAIQALSQEPCDDAISREQLLKVVTGDSFKSDFPRMSKALVEIIKALPPVSTTKNIVNHGTMNISL